MSQLPEQLVKHARELAMTDKTKPAQVNLRRAISASYYAVFHAVADEYARRFHGDVRGSAARMFEHRIVKQNASTISENREGCTRYTAASHALPV